MNEQHKETGKRLLQELKNLSKYKSLTETVIADFTGLKQQSVNRMFSGNFMPTLDNLIKLCDAIGVDLIIKERN